MYHEGELIKKGSEKGEEEILKIEGDIDELHERKPEGESSKSASSEGTRFAETFELGPDWQDFIIHMDEVSALTGISEKHIYMLLEKFAGGKLNDPGEEENRKELAALKQRFDNEIYQKIKKEREEKGSIIK